MPIRAKVVASLFAILFAFLVASPGAARVKVTSQTLARAFEREVDDGGTITSENVFPVYEYLQADAGSLDEEGFAVHGFGWLRHDLTGSGYYEDDTEAEFLYGYLSYEPGVANLSVRLGRQYLFARALDESLDGVSVSSDVTRWGEAQLYAGSPVSLEEDGRSGDLVYGLRLAHHLGNTYEIGASYRRLDADGSRDEEEVGGDASLFLGGGFSIFGRTVYNLKDAGFAEHSWEALATTGGFLIRPYFSFVSYDNFFRDADNSAGPFRFLEDSDETLTTYGGDVTYALTETVKAGARLKHYEYGERNSDANYFGGLVTWGFEPLSELGAEAGYMGGKDDEFRYYLGRVWAYKDIAPGFLSADVVYVAYMEEIYGEDASLFVSLGGGMRFLEDALEVRLSGDYSMDPYFENDVRGLLGVILHFDHIFKNFWTTAPDS